MMHIPHKLTDEFPDVTVLIMRLTRPIICSGERLAVTTRSIVRSFASNRKREFTADEVLERLKKERLKLKDQIARMLTRTERRM